MLSDHFSWFQSTCSIGVAIGKTNMESPTECLRTSTKPKHALYTVDIKLRIQLSWGNSEWATKGFLGSMETGNNQSIDIRKKFATASSFYLILFADTWGCVNHKGPVCRQTAHIANLIKIMVEDALIMGLISQPLARFLISSPDCLFFIYFLRPIRAVFHPRAILPARTTFKICRFTFTTSSRKRCLIY